MTETPIPSAAAQHAVWDVVIVGGGVAGLSAALILARARRRVLVLDGGEPRNRFAPHMHGVIGRDGYSPLDLVADGRREVRAADGVVAAARVATVAAAPDGHRGFDLVTETGERIRTLRLVVATGIRDELPGVPGLAEQWGRGVVACPYCDGFEARGRRIGVLLASPAGVHKAQLLRGYSPSVTVFTALAGHLPDGDVRALSARGIRIDDRAVARVVSDGDGGLEGLEFDDGSTVRVDALFADARMVALDDLLHQLGARQSGTPAGPWTQTDAAFETSVPGVYAVGNVADPAALVPVAAASGVTAAVAINSAMVLDEVAAALADAALADAGLAS